MSNKEEFYHPMPAKKEPIRPLPLVSSYFVKYYVPTEAQVRTCMNYPANLKCNVQE